MKVTRAQTKIKKPVIESDTEDIESDVSEVEEIQSDDEEVSVDSDVGTKKKKVVVKITSPKPKIAPTKETKKPATAKPMTEYKKKKYEKDQALKAE